MCVRKRIKNCHLDHQQSGGEVQPSELLDAAEMGLLGDQESQEGE